MSCASFQTHFPKSQPDIFWSSYLPTLWSLRSAGDVRWSLGRSTRWNLVRLQHVVRNHPCVTFESHTHDYSASAAHTRHKPPAQSGFTPIHTFPRSSDLYRQWLIVFPLCLQIVLHRTCVIIHEQHFFHPFPEMIKFILHTFPDFFWATEVGWAAQTPPKKLPD